MGCYNSPPKKNFRPRKLPEGNNSGYETFILLSDSQVALSLVGPTQITFTKTISLPRNRFTSRSSILTCQVWKVKLSLTYKPSTWITSDTSNTYFLNWDTWNTSWRFYNDGGNAIRYATIPTFSIISNGPTKRGVNFQLQDSLSKTHDHQPETQCPSSSYNDSSSVYSETISSSLESS